MDTYEELMKLLDECKSIPILFDDNIHRITELVEDLVDENHSLSSDLECSYKDYEQLSNEYDELEEQNAKLESTIDDLNAEISALEDELFHLRDKP